MSITDLNASRMAQALARSASASQSVTNNLADFDRLPDSAKARVQTVAALWGISVPTVWRRVRSGLLPGPSKIGGTTVWTVGELREALRGAR